MPTRDMVFSFRGRSKNVPAVHGWHCPMCGECEFDEGERRRYSEAVYAFAAAVDAEDAAKPSHINRRFCRLSVCFTLANITEDIMGLIYTDITLSNARKPGIKPLLVSALVDTGAVHLCIPEHIALQLDLDTYEEREVETADGTSRKRPYVGPILVNFDKRHCLTGAMVLGNEVLLGAIPMEDMDLVVNPSRRTVTVNPANPNFAVSKAKCVTTTFARSQAPTWEWGC